MLSFTLVVFSVAISVLVASVIAPRRVFLAPTPVSLGCEQGVISAILSDPELISELKPLKSEDFASVAHGLALSLIRKGAETATDLKTALIQADIDEVTAAMIATPLISYTQSEYEHASKSGKIASPTQFVKLTQVDLEYMRVAHKTAPKTDSNKTGYSPAVSLGIGYAEQVARMSDERSSSVVDAVLVSNADGLEIESVWVKQGVTPFRSVAYAALSGMFSFFIVDAFAGNGAGSAVLSLLVLGVVTVCASATLIADVDKRSLIIDDLGLVGIYLGSILILSASFILFGIKAVAMSFVAIFFVAVMMGLSVIFTQLIFPRLRGRATLGFGDVLLLPAIVAIPASVLLPAEFNNAGFLIPVVTAVTVTLVCLGSGMAFSVISALKAGRSKPFALGPYLLLGLPFCFALSNVPAISAWMGIG